METPTFTSSVHYQDPKAALAWLERAFGFEVTMAIEGPRRRPEMCHYEMSVGGRGRIMIGAHWEEWVKSPKSLGGANTQVVHVMLEGDLDAHCERARAAAAQISPSPRSSSTAIARTASPISRATGGPSPSTCATFRAPRLRRRSASRSWPRTGPKSPSPPRRERTGRRGLQSARRVRLQIAPQEVRAPTARR